MSAVIAAGGAGAAGRLATFWQSLRSMLLAVGVALAIRCFLCEVFQIPSGSMIPTLQVGDRIFVNKLIYGPRVPFTGVRLWSWRAPQRGEVAVFISPMPPHDDYIKRIVAVAGDRIEVRDGQVWVNDTAVSRRPLGPLTVHDRIALTGGWGTWTARAFCEAMGRDQADITVLADPAFAVQANDAPTTHVPEGYVFAMGDNRDHSSDSRRWGLVPVGALLGRASFIMFSWGEKGLDVGRMGDVVP